MVLLCSQMGFAFRPEDKDFQWPDSTEDLFDSLINPDSFHLPNSEDQRKYPNNFISFFETDASSSGSDTLDVSTIPDVDPKTWHYSALSLDQADGLPEHFNRHMSIYSIGRAACFETDIAVLPTDDVEEEYTYAATAPSTPRWRKKSRKPSDNPSSVRTRQSSLSPSKIEKTQHRATTMRRVSPHKASQSGRLLTKHLHHAAAAAGQFNIKTPRSNYTLAIPPPSTQLQSGSFEWDFSEEQAMHSPDTLHDDFDDPMSPLSNGYSRIQHQNIPANTPGTTHGLQTLRRIEPQPCPPQNLSSYLSSPLDPHLESFSLTPPATAPMSNGSWSPSEDPFMQNMASPSGLRANLKAGHDPWFTGVDQGGVTCGTSAASIGFGLGINCADDRGDQVDFDTYSPSGMQGSRIAPQQHSLMHHSPTLSGRSKSRPMSGDFSVSALSPSMQQSMYPMSPLLGQEDHGIVYGLSASRQQTIPAYSPSPAQTQPRQTYRPSHQRSHTIGASMSSIPPPYLPQPAYASLSFPPSLPSPSPPPTTRTARTSATSQRQRSKSAHYSRRKSTCAATNGHHRQSSVGGGFVNFTPDDSRKILTGVAPSGSSKTKARRDKEAAEKRRKLSEAAKRAVLEAGGDLEVLEREVMALTE